MKDFRLVDNIEDVIPLSPLQEGMLYHYIKDPASDLYLEQISFRIQGVIHTDMVEDAWNKVIEKYEVLRTIYRWESLSSPIQIILKKNRVNFTYNDLTGARVASDNEIEILKMNDRNEIDLKNVPFKISLCKLEEEQHLLVLSYHHILLDGWSLSILMKDFIHYYSNDIDRSCEDMKVKLRYKEYIKLVNNDENDQMDFWKDYLDEMEFHPIFTEKKFNYSKTPLTYQVEFDESLSSAVYAFAKDKELSVASIIYCCWGILLQRFTDSNEVCFGTVCSGRNMNLTGIENMVGLLINTLPVRFRYADVSGEKAVREMQSHIQARTNCEHASLVMLKEIAGVQTGDEFFDSIVVIENYPIDESAFKDISFEMNVDSVFEKSQYKLMMSVFPQERLRFHFTCDAEYVSDKEVSLLAKHLKTIIKFIIESPNETIDNINIIDKQEMELYQFFNNTQKEYPDHKQIHVLFQEQVQKKNDEIAIVYNNESITYGKLNEKSNQVARNLINEYRLKQGEPVGIYLNRSIEMFVAIFAILKAGGVCLPLDISAPRERINLLIKESETNIILTSHELKTSIYEDKRQLIVIDDIFNSEIDTNNIDTRVSEHNNKAFFIFTSGSTGKPKGVILHHKGVINHAFTKIRLLNIESSDILGHSLNTNFVASIWLVLSPLFVGAKLIVFPHEVIRDPMLLMRNVSNHGVTIVEVIPSLLQAYLQRTADSWGINDLESLKYLVLTGEKVSANLVKEFYQRYTVKLVNAYGQTECSDDTLHYIIPKQTLISVPLGNPSNNTEVIVINRAGKVQPIGFPGEICISGDGLASGYFKDEELTKKKFILHPFKPGQMLYKTGDQGKWLPEGLVHLTGRLDYQIKVRGYRIELGEIENQLIRHNDITESIVTSITNEYGETEICAYYIAVNEINEMNLRKYLKKYLPDYMIPFYFIFLEKWPLNSNGKIDRKMLPKPVRIDVKRTISPPKTWTEVILVDIIRDIIGVDNVGVKENIFDLGTHSLHVTKLVSTINKRLGVSLSYSIIFQNPTINELAGVIVSNKESLHETIQTAEPKSYYPASSAQKRLYILSQKEEMKRSYNIPGGFEINGSIDVSKIKWILQTIVDRHDALRTGFEIVEGELVQRIHSGIKFELEFYQTKENEISEIIKSFVRPFDLNTPPLVRATLVELELERYLLLFDIHHVISDGRSISILIKEFTQLYNNSHLDKRTIEYKDYVEWKRIYDQSDKIKKQEAYWMNVFREPVQSLTMPTDFSRPKIQNYEGSSVKFVIDSRRIRGLKQLAAGVNSTLYMMVLSLYTCLLHKYSGQRDMVVGAPIEGRLLPELDNVVGLFVNTLALRINLTPEMTFTQHLMAVRKNTIGAYENQEYPFELLVTKLDIVQDRSRNPLFDTMFVMHNMDNTDKTTPKLSDLGFVPLTIEQSNSKFDITLYAVESVSELECTIEYATSLFKEITIRQFIQNFFSLIDAVLVDAHTNISSIDVDLHPSYGENKNDGTVKALHVEDKLIHLNSNNKSLTPEEVLLFEVWGEVLKTSAIGIWDDFFDLGGDSIIAMKTLSKLYQKGYEVELRTIFKYPVIAELSQHIKPISKTKSEKGSPTGNSVKTDELILNDLLLNKISDRLRSNNNQNEAILQFEIEDIYALTPMQKGMFFHGLVNEISSANFVQSRFKLYGKLDIPKFEQSLNLMIERHEILRTNFFSTPDEPVQVVFKSKVAEFNFIDISDKTDTSHSLIVESYAEQDKDKGFDLERGSLMRLTIIRTSEESYDFIWSFHHILMDGWCMSIVAKETLDLYYGKSLSNPISFRKYIKWIERRESEIALNYWTGLLSGYDLQTDLPGKITVSNLEKGATISNEYRIYELGDVLSTSIYEISRKSKVTTNVLIQSAWGILLQLYNNCYDVVFGSVVSVRPAEIYGIETMIGLFINTIPVRVKCDPEDRFVDVINSLQEQLISSTEFSTSPLFEIQTQTKQKQNLINNIVVFQNNPSTDWMEEVENEAKLKFSNMEVNEQSTYDFNLFVYPGKDIKLHVQFNPQKFDGIDVERIIGNFIHILSQVINNPYIRIGDIEGITEEEKNKILETFNDTFMDIPSEVALHQYIQQQSVKRPDQIALICGEHSLTYRELNERSNVLARMLVSIGFDPKDLAGVIIDRSPDMIVAILGILKAGGAYLPIDPQLPSHRMNYMLTDSGTKYIVTNQNLEYDSKKVIRINELDQYQFDKSDINLMTRPSDLAYVMYTSGSTGRPKGVMITHGSLTNLFFAMGKSIPYEECESILCLTTVAFDIFIMESLIPLARGMKVIIATEENQLNPTFVAQLVHKHKIHMLQSTPSRIKLFLKYADRQKFNAIKNILIGGESFPTSLLKELKNMVEANIFNMYGPTETTVWSTVANLTMANTVDIGRPIANTRIYILSEFQKLVPIGVIGELCIGGNGLAVGYVNQEILTSERFINNPFNPGEKIYRTGDLARWLPNGSIEIIGRSDQQTKIRGYRIELEEIEEVINSYDLSIKSAVVIGSDSNGINVLYAYIENLKEINSNELRMYLSQRLPSYMIPNYCLDIQRLPYTYNGKLDRKSLPIPDLNINNRLFYDTPQNELQEQIHSIWSETLLHVKEFGIRDDFFELGGHSIDAIRIADEINKAFSANIPFLELFRNTTIEAQSLVVEKSKFQELHGIATVEPSNYYPLSAEQSRMYILQQMNPDNTNYNMPTFLQLQGDLDKLKVSNTFQKLICRHESLRSRFDYHNGEIVRIVSDDVSVEIEYDCGNQLNIEEMIRDFIQPFDLSKSPLLRLRLVSFGDDNYFLFVDMHHIISDGTSSETLIEEFAKIYRGEPLPELSLQYRDYTAWQHSLKENSKKYFEMELFWLNQMQEGNSKCILPKDNIVGISTNTDGKKITVHFDVELTLQIREIAQKLKTTPYTLLFSVYNVLLSGYTGIEDVTIGVPLDGRNQAELHHVVGMFVNVMPVSNKVSPQIGFDNFVADVSRNNIAVLNHRAYQYDWLVTKLGLNGESMLFDTMFTYQNKKNSPSLNDCTVSVYNYLNHQTQVDLQFCIMDATDTIDLSVEYNLSYYNESTVMRYAAMYKQLIMKVVMNPQELLTELTDFKKSVEQVDEEGFCF